MIIGGVVAVGAGVWLINSGWSPSQSHQAASYETPTATAEFARVVESTKASALSEKDDVTAMQVRLADLGYLSAAPTGTIGPKTRAALRSFKAANGLPVDELYDNTTKSRLFAKNAVRVPGPLAVVANTQSPATQRMLKLSETDRNNSWTRLLQGSGERCDAASRSMYEGGRKDTGDFWSVACTDGRSYRISVAYDASGSTKIVSCSVLKAVGSECFKKL